MIHHKFYLRTSYTNKKGEHPVYLRLNEREKVSDISLNIWVKVKSWNKDNQRVTSKDLEHTNKNKRLFHYNNKATSIINDHILKNKKLSISEFTALFNDSFYGDHSFYSYVEKVIEEKKGINQPGTLKVMNDQVNKLKAFKPELMIHEIDLAFILLYEKHLKIERKNNDNTVSKSMKFLKQILLHASKNRVIEKSPFINYQIRRIEGKREHLTEPEVKKLVELFQGNELKWNKSNVLRYFLFSCFTGLAYADIKNLRKRDIITIENNGIERKMINISRKKTGTSVRVPLLPEAELFIPDNIKNDAQKVFRVFTDQPTNRYLKELVKMVKIQKNISFHCGRHTFATICKSKGIEFDVIAKYLGHTDLKTTEIYAKYENELLISEIDKWNFKK